MGDLVALMIDDSWLFCYLMIVVVADLAILHYVNGVSFLAEEESQEEVKEKMDECHLWLHCLNKHIETVSFT